MVAVGREARFQSPGAARGKAARARRTTGKSRYREELAIIAAPPVGGKDDCAGPVRDRGGEPPSWRGGWVVGRGRGRGRFQGRGRPPGHRWRMGEYTGK